MVILSKKNLNWTEIKKLKTFLVNLNVDTILVQRDERVLFIVLGKCGELTKRDIAGNNNIDKIIEIDRPYKLACKSILNQKTKIKLKNNLVIGNKKVIIMAGPCSVESKKQISSIAQAIKSSGCHILRGGAFKPRTAPYDFQGLGKIALHFLKLAGDQNNMPIITEIMDVRDIETIHKYTDIFQLGTRSMQNYPLLKELGKQRKPILLKRGMWATYKEFLLAAEYILVGGNNNVILCERGIRTHVPETRFTLDLNAVAYLKSETHLPVVVDPSHGTGRASLVRAMSKGAIACGADGLLIEAHLNPTRSISDSNQAISTRELSKLVKEVKRVAQAVDRN